MAEKIWTMMGGLDASRGDSLNSTNEKIYYPWDPDVIEVNGDGKVWPGGHSYSANDFNGKYSRFAVYGSFYNGSKKSQHIHHKYSIFHGQANHIGEKINKGSDSPPTLTDSTRQIIAYPMITYFGEHSKKHGICRWSYANYSTSKGTTIPVYGLSIDVTIVRGGVSVLDNGDNFKKDTDASQSYYDIQVDKIHGIWAEQPGGYKWESRVLLPNGDNWGGASNSSDPDNGKYIFYNHGGLSDSSSPTQKLNDNSQHKNYGDSNKKGGDKPYTIKALLPAGDLPPRNYLFMGFTISFVTGHEANMNKTKTVFLSNVAIIDKVNADIIRNNPAYHGINPKTTGLKRLVVPRTLGINELTTTKLELQGKRPNW